jgi:hypothetical protein
MKKSERICNIIHSWYNKSEKLSYTKIVSHHKLLIEKLNVVSSWHHVDQQLPNDEQQVFAVQDLSSIGKNKFIGKFFYQDGAFVARLDESGGYGFITYWISFKELNARWEE